MKKKNFGRIISAMAAAAVLTAGAGVLPQSLPAAAEHSQNLTGQDAFGITSQMVIGWNLGNTLECSNTGFSSTTAPSKFAKAWGQPEPTEELVQTVKNAGFNTIRIPVTWYEHLEWDESADMYVINDTWMDYVKQTVDYAYDRDMFIILNVHHEDWVNVAEFTDATYADASKKLEDIWTQVAEEFQDYDQHLIFEGMNEPRQTGLGGSVEWGAGDANSRSYINKLDQVFVNTVRSQGSSANSERLLMLPGYCASSTEETIRAIEVPADGGNIALSVHAYSPYFFTMATDSMANHTFPGQSGYGEDYGSSLDNMFKYLKQISQDKNVPIIIGEFGASDFENTDSRVAWAKYYLNNAKNAGIPCVLWDNNVPADGGGEAHGYVYRKTNTWYPNSAPVIQAMMDVYGVSCTLPEYQEYVAPAFSWDLIPVGDDWVELFKPEGGKTYEAWKNNTVSGWKDYVNEDYKLVMVYQSESDPEIVLQPEWNRIPATEITEPFMATFTYEDITASLNGASVSDMSNLYVSATTSPLTVYGLYAVPVKAQQPTEEPTAEPTEESTAASTEEPTKDAESSYCGDTNSDGKINVLDLVYLKRIVWKAPALTAEDLAVMDCDGSGEVGVSDIVALQKYMLGFGSERIGKTV